MNPNGRRSLAIAAVAMLALGGVSAAANYVADEDEERRQNRYRDELDRRQRQLDAFTRRRERQSGSSLLSKAMRAKGRR